MKSIVNPKIMVNSFWSIPEKEETAFRIMRYVIRIDYKERALLHNVVTGQLVEIDNDEKLVIDSLPTLYSEKMDALIDNYFLCALRQVRDSLMDDTLHSDFIKQL